MKFLYTVNSNVRYFNWRLSAEEVKEDFFVNNFIIVSRHKLLKLFSNVKFLFLLKKNEFQKKPIGYGSKIALVHVSTRKYLSTKGIKYDFGPQNQQYMVFTDSLFVILYTR